MNRFTSMMFTGIVALTATSVAFAQPSQHGRSSGSHSGNRSGANHGHAGSSGQHVSHASGSHHGSTSGHVSGYRGPTHGHNPGSYGHNGGQHVSHAGPHYPGTTYAGPRIAKTGPTYNPRIPAYVDGNRRIIDTFYPPYGGSRSGSGGVIIVDRFDPPAGYNGTVDRYYPPYGGSRWGNGGTLIVDRFTPTGEVCDAKTCTTDVVAGEPVLETPDETATSPWQTQKYIEVKNTSAKNMKVRLVYFTEDKWLPEAADGNNEPLTYDINPGEKCRLSLATGGILASRIRIWVETDSGAWTEYRDKDLVLVEEAYQSPDPLASVIQLGS